MASSLTILHCVLVLSSAVMLGCQAACPQDGNWERVPGTPQYYCYTLLNVSEGVFNFWVVSRTCRGLRSSTVVTFNNKTELNAVREWALTRGLPADGESGFWTGYLRRREAPEDDQGILSSEKKAVRRSRVLFVDGRGWSAPEILWRDETQPGDKLDKRDEICTAQSHPGRPEFLGIDDYSCQDYKRHYGICRYEMTG